MNMIYDPTDGFFKFDYEFYRTKNTWRAKQIKVFNNRFVARAEADNVLKSLQKNHLGEVPCNVKWSNSHRIDPGKEMNCIHFSAASKGDIFVLFASVPTDYTTWIYLQLSPKGVAFYKSMKVVSLESDRASGTLGDASLFETFFVCVKQGNNKKIQMMYGKVKKNPKI